MHGRLCIRQARGTPLPVIPAESLVFERILIPTPFSYLFFRWKDSHEPEWKNAWKL
jgi:hypothetical protein